MPLTSHPRLLNSACQAKQLAAFSRCDMNLHVRHSFLLLLLLAFFGSCGLAFAQHPPGTTINFGQQTVGTTSAERVVATVQFYPGFAGTIRFLVSGNSDFRPGPSNTCPTIPTIPPSTGSCTFTLVFTPTQIGPRSGQLIYRSTGCVPFGCADQTWPLTGVGVAVPPPNAPTGLSAMALSSVQASLSWRDNSANESGFYVERSTNGGGPFTRVTTTTAGVTSYQDANLNPSTTYFYRVQAFGAGGSSSYSNASVTTLSSRCDINSDGQFNILDVQLVVNQALGITAQVSDINLDGVVNVLDVQLVVNSTLGPSVIPASCRGL